MDLFGQATTGRKMDGSGKVGGSAMPYLVSRPARAIRRSRIVLRDDGRAAFATAMSYVRAGFVEGSVARAHRDHVASISQNNQMQQAVISSGRVVF